MGKLTDSLKATTKKLDDIKHGIQEMQELGRELADNTLNVADAAMRVGYAYAKAEVEQTESHASQSPVALPSAPSVLEPDHLIDSPYWTQELLKARFSTCRAAQQHLREIYRIRLKSCSWQKVVEAFNGSCPQPSSPEQRIAQLEETVLQQAHHITVLQNKLNDTILRLEKLMAIVANSTNVERP